MFISFIHCFCTILIKKNVSAQHDGIVINNNLLLSKWHKHNHLSTNSSVNSNSVSLFLSNPCVCCMSL